MEEIELNSENNLNDDFGGFMDKKTRKSLKEKSLFSKIIGILLWIVLLLFLVAIGWDYVNFKMNKEPMFCIKKETTKYDDGTVDICTGVGYKVFKYDRESFRGREFGPFWKQDRTSEDK